MQQNQNDAITRLFNACPVCGDEMVVCLTSPLSNDFVLIDCPSCTSPHLPVLMQMRKEERGDPRLQAD